MEKTQKAFFDAIHLALDALSPEYENRFQCFHCNKIFYMSEIQPHLSSAHNIPLRYQLIYVEEMKDYKIPIGWINKYQSKKPILSKVTKEMIESNLAHSRWLAISEKERPEKKRKRKLAREEARLDWLLDKETRELEIEAREILSEFDTKRRIREARNLEKQQLDAWFGLTEELEFETNAREELALLRAKKEMDRLMRPTKKGHITH